jgi:hypothetical protein
LAHIGFLGIHILLGYSQILNAFIYKALFPALLFSGLQALGKYNDLKTKLDGKNLGYAALKEAENL